MILASFAAIVGVLTDRQVRASSTTRCARPPTSSQQGLDRKLAYDNGLHLQLQQPTVRLSDYASAEHAQIRIFDQAGRPALHPGPGQASRAPSRCRRRRSSRCRPTHRHASRARLPGRGAQTSTSSRAIRSCCSTPGRCQTSTTRWPGSSSSCCSACWAAPSWRSWPGWPPRSEPRVRSSS